MSSQKSKLFFFVNTNNAIGQRIVVVVVVLVVALAVLVVVIAVVGSVTCKPE